MAHFIGLCQGSKGEASRLGGKKTGMSTTCNGWEKGVYVRAFYDSETKTDIFLVYKTSGSNGSESELIATV